MRSLPTIPRRNSRHRAYPAHPSPVRRHNAPVILLLTVCTYPRQDVLNSIQAHDAFLAAWGTARRWAVGTYTIMPDHVHLFCAPRDLGNEPVKSWARYWKRVLGNEAPQLRGKLQWDGWDTQMRDQEHYLRKLEYVRLNPVRKGLVADADAWPYSGTVNPLDWL